MSTPVSIIKSTPNPYTLCKLAPIDRHLHPHLCHAICHTHFELFFLSQCIPAPLLMTGFFSVNSEEEAPRPKMKEKKTGHATVKRRKVVPKWPLTPCKPSAWCVIKIIIMITIIIIIMMIIIIIITIIIIIAFKGAIWDFVQSAHCAANRLQHVR